MPDDRLPPHDALLPPTDDAGRRTSSVESPGGSLGSIAPSDIPPLDPTDAIVSAIGEGISAAADAVGNAGDIAGSAASAAAEVAGSAATGLGEGCLGCGCSAAVSLGMLVLTGAAAAATLYR